MIFRGFIIILAFILFSSGTNAVGYGIKLIDKRSLPSQNLPEFSKPLPNITVLVGQDAVLPCAVKNLRGTGYKVAWIHKDKKAILTIQNHVITRNPRVEVSQRRLETWNLHIRDVQQSDQGAYMCQINTTPMKDRITQLIVVELGAAATTAAQEIPGLINEGKCTGNFQETKPSNAGNGIQRPRAGTPCVGSCKIESGRWGSSWCYTDNAKFQWGAECVSCSNGGGEEHPVDNETTDTPTTTTGMCTGNFRERYIGDAGNGLQRPRAGTPCVGSCIIDSGRWGSSYCYTDSNKHQWGAECIRCTEPTTTTRTTSTVKDQEGRVMKPKNNPVSNHPENIFDRISPFKWLVQFSDIFATMLPWLTS